MTDTPKPPQKPPKGPSNPSIFFEDWQACLRSHYIYVIQTQDEVTEPTLRHVLTQTGLTEESLLDLRDEVLEEAGIPSPTGTTFVDTSDDTSDNTNDNTSDNISDMDNAQAFEEDEALHMEGSPEIAVAGETTDETITTSDSSSDIPEETFPTEQDQAFADGEIIAANELSEDESLTAEAGTETDTDSDAGPDDFPPPPTQQLSMF